MALTTIGVTLGYATSATGTFTPITGFNEFPDLGSERETIEVTTLADTQRRYVNGIAATEEMEFGVIVTATEFQALKTLEEDGTVTFFRVGFPTLGHFMLSGEIRITLNGGSISEALEATLTVVVSSGPTYSQGTAS